MTFWRTFAFIVVPYTRCSDCLSHVKAAMFLWSGSAVIRNSVWLCQWFVFPLQWNYSVCTQLAVTESFLALCHIFYSSDEIIKSLFWDLLDLPSPLNCKEIQPVHSEGDQPWVFIGRNDAKAETPVLWPPHAKTHWKRLWCWEGLGAGGEGDDRGWDGWMASLTQWTWVWVNSGSWWWAGRLGVLWFMGSQRVGHDWAAELNWKSFLWLMSYNQLSHSGHLWLQLAPFSVVL